MSLSLNAFERYMLTDDRASHPMTFTIRTKFSGSFDADSFRRSLRRSLARHPLLSSRVEGETRHARWVHSEWEPYLDIADLDSPLRFPHSEQIDLRSENGIRVWVRTSADSTEIRVQIHHSVCDGIGAYRFVEDLLCAYDAEVHGNREVANWRPIRTDKLAQRANFGLSWGVFLLRLPLEAWGLIVGLITFFLPRPARLKSPYNPQPTAAERLVLLDYPTHTFTAEQTRQLRDVAHRAHVTLNTLLLRELFLALQSWNEFHSAGRLNRLLRIMVPISLRVASDEDLPAANVVAMVLLDRPMGIYRSPRWLLTSIKWELWFLNAFRLGLAFVRCVAFIGWLPGGLRYMARTNRCCATSVLSNVGQVLVDAQLPRREGKIIAGELVLEAVESAPPIRPHTSAAFSCVTYAGRLAVVMNYDRNHFTALTAQHLLDVYVRQIQAVAGITGSAPVVWNQVPAY